MKIEITPEEKEFICTCLNKVFFEKSKILEKTKKAQSNVPKEKLDAFHLIIKTLDDKKNKLRNLINRLDYGSTHYSN